MPTKQKLLFIVNPISGVGKQKDIPRIIERYVDRQRSEYDIRETEYAGHAREIARATRDTYDVLVAVGGDGTMNETASQLIGTNTALGIIPLGSGNGFARHLKISTDPAQAVQQLGTARSSPLDACFMNDRPFFNVSGVGFDAQVSKRFMHQIKRGYATYASCVWKEFQHYRPRHYRYERRGQVVEQTYFLVAFANTRQYGNDAIIAPHASIDDGYLDIVFVRPFPAAYLPVFTILSFIGQIHRSPYVEIIREKQFTIEQLDDPLGHIDGDYVPTETKISLNVRPRSLPVMRPSK